MVSVWRLHLIARATLCALLYEARRGLKYHVLIAPADQTSVSAQVRVQRKSGAALIKLDALVRIGMCVLVAWLSVPLLSHALLAMCNALTKVVDVVQLNALPT
jgi:hypothetical protein